MTDLLRTSLAPIPEAAWSLIREEAERVLRGHLSGRRIVDVDGPHGWERASVNLGRVRSLDKKPAPGVEVGIREVLPLVETRVPFALNQAELDNVERGAEDVDLEPVTEAARKIAAFEEGVLYDGFSSAGIQGLVKKSPHKPISIARSPESLVEGIRAGILALEQKGIGGPYAVVLDTKMHPLVKAGAVGGYPVRGRISELVKGGVHWSPVLSPGALVSTRGGDFSLTLGQDISIGYRNIKNGNVELFLVESFTFRVLEPAAAVAFRAKA